MKPKLLFLIVFLAGCETEQEFSLPAECKNLTMPEQNTCLKKACSKFEAYETRKKCSFDRRYLYKRYLDQLPKSKNNFKETMSSEDFLRP